MMAHLDPKALQHIVEPEIELRLDALAERIAQGELLHLRHTAAQPLNLCQSGQAASPAGLALYGADASGATGSAPWPMTA